MKKFVVIHTTPTTIAPIGALIGELPGRCQVFNLLDDSILPEINEAGCITPGVRARLYALLSVAQNIDPDAILCACSSIGKVKLGMLPVGNWRYLTPNEVRDLVVASGSQKKIAAGYIKYGKEPDRDYHSARR